MQWQAILVWTAYVAAVFVIIRRRLAARRTLSPIYPEDPGYFPSISFIIPARDEADNIVGCLESLRAQEYPAERVEILVVDDNSSDATVAHARQVQSTSPRVNIISAPPLPDDWFGKPYACWLGASRAKSEWLCFVDADVRLRPDLMAAAVTDVIQNQADLLSLHPHQQMVSFGERFLMPPALMGLLILMDFDRINDPNSRLAMANGQFILVRRDRYIDFDGHRSVKREVLEDVALARQAKRSGLKLRLLAGGDLIQTRMYTNAASVWGGLTRGAVEMAGGPLFASATIGSSLVLGWLPILLPIAAWLTTALTPTAKALVVLTAVSTSAVWYGALGLILRWYKVPMRYLLLLPLSFSALALATADGLQRYLTGRRTWKGRHL